MGALYERAARFPRWLCATGRAFRDMITGVDGTTVAPSRVYWLLWSSVGLILSIWSVVILKQPFNMTDFGTGGAAILAAGGASVWMTRKTEPSS